MKKLISLLSLAMLMAGNVAFTAVAASTYSGVDNSNAFADSVIYTEGVSTFEKTSDAADANSSDVIVGEAVGDDFYFGFAQAFDGVSIDIGTSASSGEFITEYWDGSSWETLLANSTDNIQNDSTSGIFALEWERPSDWTKTTVEIDFTASGEVNVPSPSLYFARIRITNDYSNTIKADQLGILDYNAVFNVDSELGDWVSMGEGDVSFSSSTGDTTIYAEGFVHDDSYAYALYTPSTTTYTATFTVDGFVQKSASVSLSEAVRTTSIELQYTQVLVAEDPDTGNGVEIDSATAGTTGVACVMDNDKAYCPVTAANDNSTATIYADGYAPTSIALQDRSSDSSAQVTNTAVLNYAYIATVKDEDGDTVSNASVEMGSSFDIDCEYISAGQYGCVVPTDEDAEIRISGSGFDTVTSEFSSTRDSNSDSQVTKTFTVGENTTSDGPDLSVETMDWDSDGDFTFTLQNEGNEAVSSSENVYVAIYVDGDREYYEYFENESGDDWLDAGEEEDFDLGDNFFDDEDEEYEVEICVDSTDTVDEEDEDNNCMEETLSINGSGDGVDLEVEDLYLESDDDLIVVVSNTGDDDVDDSESVKLYVYVEGTVEYTLVIDESDDTSDFFQSGDSSTINVGDNLLDDHGSQYDVEVCIDVGDSVDEDDESNNCREEDEDELEEDPENGSCGDFVDIDGHWGEEYICNLYDRDVVDGYNQYYFKPDDDVSRAEFLKMALLGAEKDTYDTSVYYDDVDDSDWFYEFVSYATTKDFVEGYSDGTFRPNEDINRAEALVIMFRIAGEEDYDYSSSDIDFSDVSYSNWFAWAVVLADDLDIINGYNDGSFGPSNDLSRAEAAKIIDLAYEEFYN
ncbi:MAG: S-layer homology domain-containing protein [Candidatus Gracilibacteria bacterium]|jgi:hypothetical protein